MFFELRSICNSTSARENTNLGDFIYEFTFYNTSHKETTNLTDFSYEFTEK